MAWRVDQQVVRGEIDNAKKGVLSGRIWFIGCDEPVILDLVGNPWRDLAGCRLTFTNPNPIKGGPGLLHPLQKGVVGDMTASRKVKVPDISMEEFREYYAERKPFPWHWGNSLYLEWFSEYNGRVVIEAAHYDLVIDPDRTWTMTAEEEKKQARTNHQAMLDFMGKVTEAVAAYQEEEDDDSEVLSDVEKKADAEAARMDLLLDRIQARLEREWEAASEEERDDLYERIMREERERLRKERGEPEPEPLSPEEEAERQEWIEEMNAAAEEAARDMEAEKWKGEGADPFREHRHPLQEAVYELSLQLRRDIERNDWLTENDPSEHPLCEIITGTMIASAKLAGALNRFGDETREWPPDELTAGDTLVRLKKAREAMRDALAGLDACDEQNLTSPEWRSSTRAALRPLLVGIERLIAEIRESLQ